MLQLLFRPRKLTGFFIKEYKVKRTVFCIVITIFWMNVVLADLFDNSFCPFSVVVYNRFNKSLLFEGYVLDPPTHDFVRFKFNAYPNTSTSQNSWQITVKSHIGRSRFFTRFPPHCQGNYTIGSQECEVFNQIPTLYLEVTRNNDTYGLEWLYCPGILRNS